MDAMHAHQLSAHSVTRHRRVKILPPLSCQASQLSLEVALLSHLFHKWGYLLVSALLGVQL